MNQFVKHLKRCAVCGSIPKIHYVYEHGHHYKLFCSKNAVHNSTGEWFSNKYQACLDWNARQQVRKVAKQKENLQLLHSKRSLLFRGQQRRKGEKVRLDGSPMESSWFYGSGVLQGKGDFSVIYQTEPNFDKHAVYTDTIDSIRMQLTETAIRFLRETFFKMWKQKKSWLRNGLQSIQAFCCTISPKM